MRLITWMNLETLLLVDVIFFKTDLNNLSTKNELNWRYNVLLWN